MKDFWNNLAPGQVSAFMRHIYTAFASATAMLLFVGLTQGDVTTMGNALHQIGDGIVSVVTGIAALIPVLSGVYASISASRASRLAVMNADPQIEKVKTVPGTPAAAVAAELPGNKVS